MAQEPFWGPQTRPSDFQDSAVCCCSSQQSGSSPGTCQSSRRSARQGRAAGLVAAGCGAKSPQQTPKHFPPSDSRAPAVPPGFSGYFSCSTQEPAAANARAPPAAAARNCPGSHSVARQTTKNCDLCSVLELRPQGSSGRSCLEPLWVSELFWMSTRQPRPCRGADSGSPHPSPVPYGHGKAVQPPRIPQGPDPAHDRFCGVAFPQLSSPIQLPAGLHELRAQEAPSAATSGAVLPPCVCGQGGRARSRAGGGWALTRCCPQGLGARGPQAPALPPRTRPHRAPASLGAEPRQQLGAALAHRGGSQPPARCRPSACPSVRGGAAETR